jgi:hypothetical protein
LANDGAKIIVQSTENEFYIAGTGLTVSFFRNPHVDSLWAESKASNGNWSTHRRLNGDQTNQGRQLLMSARQVRVYRVLLYATPRNAQTR